MGPTQKKIFIKQPVADGATLEDAIAGIPALLAADAPAEEPDAAAAEAGTNDDAPAEESVADAATEEDVAAAEAGTNDDAPAEESVADADTDAPADEPVANDAPADDFDTETATLEELEAKATEVDVDAVAALSDVPTLVADNTEVQLEALLDAAEPPISHVSSDNKTDLATKLYRQNLSQIIE